MLEVPTFTSHGHQELFQFISGSDSSPVPWCPPPSDTETRATQCLLALSSVTTQPTEALSAHQKTPRGARQEPWSPGEGSKQNTIAKLSLWNLSPQEKARPSALPQQDDHDHRILELDPELPRCSECSSISQSHPNQESHVLNKETLNLQIRQCGAQ